ncbi:hypothetical protein FOZ63_001675, partial [Perkinsus olseni]
MNSRVDDPSKTDESGKPNMATAGDDPTPKNEDVDGKSDTDDSVMGALLKDEESYKKELTKRRDLRGRLRGKIQEVQAAVECIIVPEGQKTTDELQALETKESLLHDLLRRAEQDIAELQQLRQEVVSKIGKEQYRSSSSKSVFSVTDRIRGGTSTSEGYLSLASDGGANQSVDEHEDKQKANDDEHEDKEKTRDSRTVPGKGEDQRASVVVVKASPRSLAEMPVPRSHTHKAREHAGVKASPRSLAEMPVPRSHTHKAREHAGVDQRENTRRGVRSGINTQGVSKLALPECEDVLDLDSHFEVVEGILEESGAGSYVKGNEGQLTFVLREDIRMACVGKLLTTLPSGAVRDCAKRAAQRSRYCWERVKEQLRCRFWQKIGYNQQHQGVPSKTQLWGSREERVISEVKREARLQRGSYRDVSEEDWETLLSFSPEVQGGSGDITIVDIIRDVSRTAEDTSRREADRVAWVAQTTNSQDSGTGGAPPGKGAASSARPPKQSLESWARGFKASFVVTVRQLDEQEIKSTFQPDDWKPLRSKGKGQGQRFGRVVGAVVGYNDEAKGKAVIAKVGEDAQLKEKFRVRPFAFKDQGNDKGRIREEEKGVAGEEVEDKVCLIYLEVPVELQVRTDVVSAVDPKYRIQGVKDQGARKCIPTTRVAKWAKLADGSRTAITEEAE